MRSFQPILALGTLVSGQEDEPAVSDYSRVDVWNRERGGGA